MRTAILLAICAALFSGGVALAWDFAVVTDEERVREVLGSIVDARDASRADAFARVVALEAHPLEVSAPGVDHVYDTADQAPLLDLVAEAQSSLGGAELSVLQSEVVVRGDTAHATLNVEVSRGEDVSYVPMDLDLHRMGDGFVLTRIRFHR
jgi:hypothetical protein